jgi:hypothetical protein
MRWALRLRAALVFWLAERGMTSLEIADDTSLSEEDVDRIVWWKRSVGGEHNGGWLS